MKKIFIDGSCRATKKGAYGALVVHEDAREEYLTGVLDDTTNNVMELSAMLVALYYIQDNEGTYVICCDSQYVIKGLTEWVVNWKNFGWKTYAGKAVKNKEIWRRLSDVYDTVRDRVEIRWVKGHDGNEYNEKIDAAVQALTRNS